MVIFVCFLICLGLLRWSVAAFSGMASFPFKRFFLMGGIAGGRIKNTNVLWVNICVPVTVQKNTLQKYQARQRSYLFICGDRKSGVILFLFVFLKKIKRTREAKKTPTKERLMFFFERLWCPHKRQVFFNN